MKPVLYLCHVPLYRTAVLFVGDCDAKTAKQLMYRHGKYRSDVQLPDDSIACVLGHLGDTFMYVGDMEAGSTMIHELFHAAVMILRQRGIPLCDQTEEAVAYLLGYLKLNLMDKAYEKRDKLNGTPAT